MLLPLLASASCAGSLRADIRQSDVFNLGRMICAICHDLLTTHLTRRLEDKLIHHSIDFRPFHIHMDTRDIHQGQATRLPGWPSMLTLRVSTFGAIRRFGASRLYRRTRASFRKASTSQLRRLRRTKAAEISLTSKRHVSG